MSADAPDLLSSPFGAAPLGSAVGAADFGGGGLGDLDAPAAPPTVSDRAFARLAEIAAAAGGPQMLRVAVEGGGCSGFQYDIKLETAAAPDDLVLEKDGQKVLVDPVSAPYLANAVIDWTDALIGARFAIQNPNASSSCGCGVSFSV